jgi:hypothetical protein
MKKFGSVPLHRELGHIFENHCKIDKEGISNEITLDELIKIDIRFTLGNGGSWCRDEVSFLGKKYLIKRNLVKGKIYSIQLIGFNPKSTNRSIPKKIRDTLNKGRTVTLGIGSNPEIDHKSGRYDEDPSDINSYQLLSKSANDDKRQFCKECKETNKRFNPSCFGYKILFVEGTDDYKGTCKGCYLHDPIYFNSRLTNLNPKEEVKKQFGFIHC